jgi:DNA-binding MarR family transcriptional regulator
MSVISIPSEPIDMKSVGFIPRLDEDNFRPKPKIGELIAVHESGEPLQTEYIETTGKSIEQIAKEIKAWEQKGLVKESQDAFRIRMLERRLKPEAFIARIHGEKQVKELADYINGIQVDAPDGTFKQIAPAHPRTWTQGHNDLLGNITIETDFEAVRKNFMDSGKFSKISEITWPEMQKMR